MRSIGTYSGSYAQSTSYRPCHLPNSTKYEKEERRKSGGTSVKVSASGGHGSGGETHPPPCTERAAGSRGCRGRGGARTREGRLDEQLKLSCHVSTFRSETNMTGCSFGCSSTFHLRGNSSSFWAAAPSCDLLRFLCYSPASAESRTRHLRLGTQERQ